MELLQLQFIVFWERYVEIEKSNSFKSDIIYAVLKLRDAKLFHILFFMMALKILYLLMMPEYGEVKYGIYR